MPKKLRNVLTLVLALVFLASTALLLRHLADSASSAGTYEAAQQLAVKPKEEPPTEAPETLPPAQEETVPETEAPRTYWVPAPVEDDPNMEELAAINLDALRESNPDVVGWISIPGTIINYPIMQGEDNEFYLRHDWLKKESVLGSIFLESTNTPDLKDFRSIVYGHNMENGSMFRTLQNYEHKNHWNNHPYVYLVTDEGVLRYEVYSSYKAKIDSYTYALDLDESDEKNEFIWITVEETELDTGIVPVETDRILTLSTCVWNGDYRRVVHARLPMVEVVE